MNKHNIMTQAWNIAREGAAKFGGKVREYFSDALRMAWEATRKPVDVVAALLAIGGNEWLKGELLGYVDLPGGKQMPRSTTELTVSEFADYVTRLQAFAAAELGVIFEG